MRIDVGWVSILGWERRCCERQGGLGKRVGVGARARRGTGPGARSRMGGLPV